MENLTVFGLGFVGLPLSLTYAIYGVRVYGVDVNKEYIDRLRNFETHVFESYKGRSINEILKESIEKNLFIPTTSAEEAIRNSSSIIVTVGIPIEGNSVRVEVFEDVIRTVGKYLMKGQLVLIRSTVPPATTREIALPLIEKESNLKCGKDFYLAYSSERIAEGFAFEEFQTMPVAVAGIDEESTRRGKELLQIINKDVFTASSPEIVEISKLIENSSRDVNIALVNELATLTEKMGVDTVEVIKVANTHKRVKLLSPGIGVGGHCIPYASKYIFYKSDALGLEMQLLRAARSVNDERPLGVFELISDNLHEIGKEVSSSKFCFLGIAMKDNSSDASESPAVQLMEIVLKNGGKSVWFDPYVNLDLAGKELVMESALRDADVVVVPVIQDDLDLDLFRIKEFVKDKCIIFDARRVLERKKVENMGMIYLTV
jgi:UDP-N-acetyl-D-mannosaminuronic acid dehydrogenase